MSKQRYANNDNQSDAAAPATTSAQQAVPAHTAAGLLTANDAALQHYLHSATADNTRKAYRSAIRQFEKWGGRLPCLQEELIRYLLDKAMQLNPRTLNLHLTAISQWHKVQQLANPADSPLVMKTMEGIRRNHGRPKQKARALRLEHIARMLQQLHSEPDSLRKSRDIALLLTGFFGAFRRSELVAIRIEDLQWESEGLTIILPRSKTDQNGRGLQRALPFGPEGICPARAIRSWIKAAGIASGPLFRAINRWGQLGEQTLNPASVNDCLKRIGAACGFDFLPELSSHSLRRGMSTSAAREQVAFELIKKQGGWQSDATVWEYIEEGRRYTDNAGTVLMNKLSTLQQSTAQTTAGAEQDSQSESGAG
ncbi:tyrosine-type recombinase/integrase [Thalassolituus sp. LLYu03]|uniref:tyrosine-type recombinase/integrase n=1 Tax=Thalassolituus sp. LLYu03 TaxID=3421656 RepID=UPI003D2C5EB0